MRFIAAVIMIAFSTSAFALPNSAAKVVSAFELKKNIDTSSIISQAKAEAAEVNDRGDYYQVIYKNDNLLAYLAKDNSEWAYYYYTLENGEMNYLKNLNRSKTGAISGVTISKGGSSMGSRNGNLSCAFLKATEEDTEKYLSGLNVKMLKQPEMPKMPFPANSGFPQMPECIK